MTHFFSSPTPNPSQTLRSVPPCTSPYDHLFLPTLTSPNRPPAGLPDSPSSSCTSGSGRQPHAAYLAYSIKLIHATSLLKRSKGFLSHPKLEAKALEEP